MAVTGGMDGHGLGGTSSSEFVIHQSVSTIASTVVFVGKEKVLWQPRSGCYCTDELHKQRRTQ